MDKFLFSLFFLLLANTVGASEGPTISNLSDCSTQGWNLKRIKDKSAFGFISSAEGCQARFAIQANQKKISDGWRAELTDPLLVAPGSELSYEFETYVPSTSKREDLAGFVVAQWHDLGVPNGEIQRPPVSVRIRGDEMTFELWNSEHLAIDSTAEGIPLFALKNPFDRWVKIQLKAKWSDDETGFLNLIVDGVPVANYKGPIGYKTDLRSPYFKFGVYTVHPFEGVLEVFHRGYSRQLLFNSDSSAAPDKFPADPK